MQIDLISFILGFFFGLLTCVLFWIVLKVVGWLRALFKGGGDSTYG